MEKLSQYIIALTNLYGVVQKDKIVEIYNEQNDGKINHDDIKEYLKNSSKELKDAFVYSLEDYFVRDVIIEFNGLESMLMKKADKPYYVPRQSELLMYIDEGYFEKTMQYKALLNYVKTNFFGGDTDEAEDFCEDVHVLCQFDFNIGEILDTFNDKNIGFKSEEQVNQVVQLITELANNIRIWENNGHTPQEIFKRFEKPNLKPLPSKPFEFGVTAVKKVGRNNPCPCGSGKKYKKCCLGK